MYKKSILVLVLIVVASCSTNKAIVRTTKSSPSTGSETQMASTTKKPVYNQNTKPTSLGTNKETTTSIETNSNNTVVLEATTKVKVTTAMVLAYIEKYKDLAKQNMDNFGIPASITLGQALLESGSGTGPLSVQANNHFGIKCHKEWTGPSIRYTDDEENECFRKYEKPSQSFIDHSYFLTSRPRYAPLFLLGKDDYKAWAKGLKLAGYATDPKYPEKLIGLIERYQLQRFDAEVLGKEYVPTNIIKKEIAYADDIERYTVVKGDTLYSISKKFSISIEELKKKNNLVDNTLPLGQNIIVK